MAGGYSPVGVGALTALYGRLRQLDRVLASVPKRQSVWPDNGSQRLGRIIGQFDPDALLKPVFDYTPRAQNVVPFDLLKSISVTHRLFDYAPVFRKRTNRINAAAPKS